MSMFHKHAKTAPASDMSDDMCLIRQHMILLLGAMQVWLLTEQNHHSFCMHARFGGTWAGTGAELA